MNSSIYYGRCLSIFILFSYALSLARCSLSFHLARSFIHYFDRRICLLVNGLFYVVMHTSRAAQLCIVRLHTKFTQCYQYENNTIRSVTIQSKPKRKKLRSGKKLKRQYNTQHTDQYNNITKINPVIRSNSQIMIVSHFYDCITQEWTIRHIGT